MFKDLEIDTRNRIQTANQMGFMFLSENIVRKKLREHLRPGMLMADIGCAYGVDTLMALEEGANVIAIDLDHNHLAVLEEKATAFKQHLEIRCQRFPDDFATPPLDVALLSRVLFFLTPQEAQIALNKIYNSLKPGAHLFIIAAGPYHDNWSPVREKFELFRKTNPTDPFLVPDIGALLPPLKPYFPEQVLLFDTIALCDLLIKCGFIVTECDNIKENGTVEAYAIAQKS